MTLKNSILKKPKISIIITCYNLGKYLPDCISSILQQEYTNWEALIVNDGSDSQNSKIINRIKHEKIKIINSKENQGQLCAFMKGLSQATGEFICMVDADDILLPNYLKTLLYIHLRNNVAFVSSSCGEINQKNEVVSLNYVNNPIQEQNDEIPYSEIENIFRANQNFTVKYLSIKKTPFGLWEWNPSSSAMFRKSALEILKYYPDKSFWKTGADKVIFSLAHLIGASINTSAVCYLYRHHECNNSKTTLTTGAKKYLNEEYINTLINWNKKLRLDTIYMFISHKKEFIDKFNKLNYIKMLYRIIFCVNLKICAKVIKTFAHRLIRF